MAERIHIGGDAGRHVDAYVNSELKKKYKGKKMPKSLMDLADAEYRAEMRDPEAIMGNVGGSTEGYRARQALEDEDRRGGGDSSEVTMLDLFNKGQSRPILKCLFCSSAEDMTPAMMMQAFRVQPPWVQAFTW